MRKRNYRATSVKNVDVEGLLEKLPEGRVIFGLDIAKVKQFGTFMDARAQRSKVVSWRHPKETQSMVELVESIRATGRQVEVVMEPTGTYGDAIRYQLTQRGIPVFRVSAKHTKDVREVVDGVPSLHDRKAAFVVGWLHAQGASKRWHPDHACRREAKAATALLDVHNTYFRMLLNRIEALTVRHWPELPALLGLKSATLLTLVSTYGSPKAVSENAAQARRLMKKVSRGRVEDSTRDAVILAAKNTSGVPMSPAERDLLEQLCTEALAARQKLRAAKKKVEQLGRDQEVVRRLAALVGPATAMVLITWVGDPRGYEHIRAYYKAFGMNLAEISSGKKGETRPRLRISKRGPKIARRWLFLAALRFIQREPIVAAWHAAKVKRDGGVTKMKAVVAVMRKLLAAIWHVSRGAVFDPQRLFDVRRLGLQVYTVPAEKAA